LLLERNSTRDGKKNGALPICLPTIKGPLNTSTAMGFPSHHMKNQPQLVSRDGEKNKASRVANIRENASMDISEHERRIKKE